MITVLSLSTLSFASSPSVSLHNSRFSVVRRGLLHTHHSLSPPHPRPPVLLIPRPDLLPCLLHRPLSFRLPSGAYSPCGFRTIAGAGFGGGELLQDAGATGLVLAGAYGLVFAFDNLTQRNVIEQNLSRKLVHIMSGLLFMVSWPIFSTSTKARYFASLVPLVNCLRLVIHGLSLASDEGLVKSVTREGKPEELLRGPLYYVLILILCALIFWRESPIGVITLSMMCAGDGVADIIGRRFGSIKIPYNQHKSWAGSISMFVCGFLISIGMLYYFTVLGYFELDWIPMVKRVALVSLVATVVESLPTTKVLLFWAGSLGTNCVKKQTPNTAYVRKPIGLMIHHRRLLEKGLSGPCFAQA